jgi:hypothetical protein
VVGSSLAADPIGLVVSESGVTLLLRPIRTGSLEPSRPLWQSKDQAQDGEADPIGLWYGEVRERSELGVSG